MDATWIVTVFVMMDTILETSEHRSHPLAKVPDVEVLTVAVVAAKYFQNHHERALAVMKACRYLSGPLSTSRRPVGRVLLPRPKTETATWARVSRPWR